MEEKTLYFKDEVWYSERIFEYRGYIVREIYDQDDEKFFHHSCELFNENGEFIFQYNYDEADMVKTHIDRMVQGKENDNPAAGYKLSGHKIDQKYFEKNKRETRTKLPETLQYIYDYLESTGANCGTLNKVWQVYNTLNNKNEIIKSYKEFIEWLLTRDIEFDPCYVRKIYDESMPCLYFKNEEFELDNANYDICIDIWQPEQWGKR